MWISALAPFKAILIQEAIDTAQKDLFLLSFATQKFNIVLKPQFMVAQGGSGFSQRSVSGYELQGHGQSTEKTDCLVALSLVDATLMIPCLALPVCFPNVLSFPLCFPESSY